LIAFLLRAGIIAGERAHRRQFLGAMHVECQNLLFDLATVDLNRRLDRAIGRLPERPSLNGLAAMCPKAGLVGIALF
jgi:hypothetical protein